MRPLSLASSLLLLVLAAGCSGSGGYFPPAAKDASPDLTGVTRFGCWKTLGCAFQCESQACVAGCQAQTNTTNGRALFQALFQCENAGPCPNTGGGPCDAAKPNYDPKVCQQCVEAQPSVMACKTQITTCLNDL